MNGLIFWAAQNTVMALVLAIVVYGLTRAWRYPPAAHVLWLLVLLKLVTPPLVAIDWHSMAPSDIATTASGLTSFDSATSAGSQDSVSQFLLDGALVDDPPVSTLPVAPTAIAEKSTVSAETAKWWHIAQPVIILLWLGGAAICGLLAVARIMRFERLLQDTLPAPRSSEQLTAEIAARLGVRRVPTVRYAQFADVPMVWCAGLRPTIVLPTGLVAEISAVRLALILAHELAHLRRRDHWVRLVELFVITIYWWNPLVWIVRRQIHQAEELCCDAWVRWAYPEQTYHYAEVIFEAADRPRGPKVSRPILASPFFHSTSLKARIEMILHGQFTPNLSRTSKWIVALFALVVIPSAALNAKDEARTDATADSATTRDAKPTDIAALELPRIVQFEEGATRFADGDKIEINEVRGTAETFTPGNIYRIKGTYTLASHDRATLAAYTTAREAKDGTSVSYKVQTIIVDKGAGTFTLYLPMNCPGWPHVSFYPADGGNDFGGNYFGTGESTLKQWWGTKDSRQTAATSAIASPDSDSTNQQVPQITVTSPQVKAVTLSQLFVGSIHSHRHINVRALQRGYLEAVTLKEGQQVKQGDRLFKVIPILYQKKVEAEEAEATLARLEYKDVKKQYEDKVVSANQMALFEAKLAKAQAKADLARAELDFATIRAPFDGFVGRLQLQQGSLVQEGDILTTLSDNSIMWVYFNLPQGLYPESMQDERWDDLKIELLLASGQKFDQIGKLGAIEADVDSATGMVSYRADFLNPDRLLRHGQRGTVRISRVLNDALVIPQRSDVTENGKNYVYVVDKNNVAHRREIIIQNELDDIYVIKKGTIGTEDKIILDRVRQIRDGEKVAFEVK